MKAPLPTYTRQVYPTGGFQLNLPDGRYVMGEDFEDLVVKVASALSLSAGEAEAFTHAKLCARFPTNCMNNAGSLPIAGLDPPALASMHLSMLHSRALPRLDDVTEGLRNRTCSACPKNFGLSTPGCCGTKSSMETLASSLGNKYAVRGVFSKGWCGALGYNISLASAVDIPAITPDDLLYGQLPDFCPHRAASPE